MPERIRNLSALLLAIAVAASLLVGATPARAETTIIVDTTDDTTDCEPGDCSLRGAILEANDTAGHVTIVLEADTYALTIDGAGEDDGEEGDLDVHDDVTIVGAGSADTIIDASAIDDRVLHVHGVDLTLHGVTIQGGTTSSDGGGLFLDGEGASWALALRDVVLRGNDAREGGGMLGVGDELLLDFEDVLIADNTAEFAAGMGAVGAELTVRFDHVHIGGQESLTEEDIVEDEFPSGTNVASEGLGGGVLLTQGSADIHIANTSVVGNWGEQAYGGLTVAIAEGAETSPEENLLTLDTVEVRGNGAMLGGGFTAVGMTTTITGSTFNENLAEGFGGLFAVFGPTHVADSVIADNFAGRYAGAVFEDAAATLERVTVSHNFAVHEGGGVAHSALLGADLVLEDSTVAENTSTYGAGVLVTADSFLQALGASDHFARSSGDTSAAPERSMADALQAFGFRSGAETTALQEHVGSATVTGSTFEGNIAAGRLIAADVPEGHGAGGGIYLDRVDADITNSTFSGNAAADAGGALLTELWRADETVTLTNVTFSDNAAEEGAAIAEWTDGLVEGTSIQLVNTIVANSTGTNCSDFFGVIESLGHNIDDDGSCELDEDSDMEVDPLLDELADNGGPTSTHALLEGSPAIDAGDDDACPATDQRGFPRPAQGCDIGAFEVQQGADLAVTAEVDPDPARATYDVAVDVTATNLGPAPAEDATLTVDVPEGTAVRSVASPEDVDCTIDGQQVACDLGDVAPGDDVDITVIVRPADPGEVEITATVASATPDPDETNNVTTVTFTVTGPEGAIRLFGRNRIETAVMTSQDMYDDGTAPAVVIARGDDFADALTGTPLAIDLDAPLLLSYPGELHPATEAEIQRVLPDGGPVILLGGSAALSPAVEARLTELGYATERYFGSDRFATAVDIATRGLGDPDVLLVATGWDSADALAGGAAGGVAGGAVLLTAGPNMPDTTRAYLAARGEAARYALGGPAAQADPTATPLVGATRFQTAVSVAQTFFTNPRVAGIATAFDYPDALTGGAHVGRQGGPILLSTTDQLHPSTQAYLNDQERLEAVYLYGGEGVLSAAVEQAVAATMQ